MAQVQLADVYSPIVWARTIQEAQTRQNGFLASGVAVLDNSITEKLSGGTSTITMPQFTGIEDGEPNYSTDDPAQFAVHGKIGTQEQAARSASRNKSWSTMTLARELTDSDPEVAITNRIGYYWATDEESRLLCSVTGIKDDNVANDNSDMVLDVSNDLDPATDPVTDEQRINATNVILAEQTLGDRKTILTTIAMHSVQHTRLRLQGLLTDNFDPQTGALMYQTYLGKRVLVDDSLPAVVGTNKISYLVVLFGTGAVGYGPGPVRVPTEVERIPGSGNGAGQDVIYSRVHTCFHPYGFKWNNALITPGSTFATYDDLKNVNNWSRVVARKNVPMAFLVVND
ncbi:hypothetical protein OAB00_01210 [Akkermansiaceae bacterium]|nr:hypothetical protein [Akkermansiaceae bacterium]